jgi:hypothetical protein
VYGVIMFVSGIIMFIGGSKMRDLRGYGWSLAAAILAGLEGFCCCCLPLIPGIWALVVLLNSDVKLAFSKTAAAAAEGTS